MEESQKEKLLALAKCGPTKKVRFAPKKTKWLILGDGAGSFFDTPCGYFASVYDVSEVPKLEFVLEGGANSGSNNQAELMPYLLSLLRISGLDAPKNEPEVVKIVSDSELTVECINGNYQRKANRPLWAMLEFFEKSGWTIIAEHVPRNSTIWHSRADKEAKAIREIFSGRAK